MLYHDNDKIYSVEKEKKETKEEKPVTDKYRKNDSPIRYGRPWDTQRTPEQNIKMINAYLAWVSLFPKSEHQTQVSIVLRERAWCAYVDARDLLQDGHTYADVIAERLAENEAIQ